MLSSNASFGAAFQDAYGPRSDGSGPITRFGANNPLAFDAQIKAAGTNPAAWCGAATVREVEPIAVAR